MLLTLSLSMPFNTHYQLVYFVWGKTFNQLKILKNLSFLKLGLEIRKGQTSIVDFKYSDAF